MYDQVPSIQIYIAKEFGDAVILSGLCQGIEEEGIPFEIQLTDANDATQLAWNAAQVSRLSVGIGIDEAGIIAIHNTRMQEKTPVFLESSKTQTGNPVRLGANAARLVKGVPFKGYEK